MSGVSRPPMRPERHKELTIAAVLVVGLCAVSLGQNRPPPGSPSAPKTHQQAPPEPKTSRPTNRDAQTEQNPAEDESCAVGLVAVLSPCGNDLKPPAELLVQDARGRKTGYDPSSGKTLTEIPGSSYAGEGADEDAPGPSEAVTNVLEVCNPPAGTYRLKVTGTRAGNYDLEVRADSDEWEPSIVVKQNQAADKGSVREWLIRYSRTPQPTVEVAPGDAKH
jgi:hypothetical protein